MNTVKDSLLIKEHWPDTKIHVFYIDLRAFGKSFEDLYRRAIKNGVNFVRGLPSEVVENKKTGNLLFRGENTLSQGTYNHEVEMVVLSVGIEPRLDSDVLRRLLRLSRTSDGFFAEAHPKLKPVDTSAAGVFIAGCVESPKDIKDSVTQASAAAARASILMAKGKVTVDKVPCSGAYVSRSSCSRGLTEEQIFPQVDAATERKAERKIIAFCCDLCSCGAVDSAGMNRIQYPASIRVVRTGCLRRVAPEFVKRAFERRAAAVMVACCPVQNGHRTCAFSGMRRELRALRRRMEAFGIDKRRLVSVSVDASEHELFVSKIVEMQKSVDGIKPEDIERSVQLFKQL